MEKDESIVETKEKGPWIYKTIIVALPVGLALSAVIAVGLKVSKEEKTGLEGISYSAQDFSVANLRDAAGKAEEVIGTRNFETDDGQKAMQQMTAFITGSLSSLNLGYRVRSDKGEVVAGRIWKNYWIDSKEEKGEGTLVVWTNYARKEDSATVAALLSLAEWLRGRNFGKRVRVAFVRDAESLESVTADLLGSENLMVFEITGLGQGSEGILKTGGFLEGAKESAVYQFVGKAGPQSASNWKMTTSWDHFEAQVRELCREVATTAR